MTFFVTLGKFFSVMWRFFIEFVVILFIRGLEAICGGVIKGRVVTWLEVFQAVCGLLVACPGYFRVFPMVSATFIVLFIGFMSCFLGFRIFG